MQLITPPQTQGGAVEPIGAAEAEALFAPLAEAAALAVAVSGGPDSMALMAMLARWRAASPGRPVLHVFTVDHGLRAESGQEAAMVGREASWLGLPHRVLRWEGAKPTAGLQAAARSARYDLLAAAAMDAGCDMLVTAHHADDQFETILLRLIAGSGPAGLCGMRQSRTLARIRLMRPLLAVPKARLIATVRERGLPFVDDPGNISLRFGRGRLRAMTALLYAAGLTPGRLGALTMRLQRAEDALSARARAVFGATGVDANTLPWSALQSEPAEIRLRVLELALVASGVSRQAIRLHRLERLMLMLDAAAAERRGHRATLAGRTITLSTQGNVSFAPEPPRSRGSGGHRSDARGSTLQGSKTRD